MTIRQNLIPDTDKRPGNIFYKALDDGREIVVYPMMFTARLCVGLQDDYGYSRAWCYPSAGRAIMAASEWDGEGDPPDGWIKEVGTERRREGGDPNKEYDASKELPPRLRDRKDAHADQH